MRTDHLEHDDQVLTSGVTILRVTGMSAPQGTQQVFNLSISGAHTYYISETSILVHNANPLFCSGLSDKKLAQKLDLSIDSPLIANRGMTMAEYVAKFRKGSIRQELGTDVLGMKWKRPC